MTWHDGTPFTSADVKFTFEEILLQFSSRTKAALGPVLDGIDTPDDATVVFRFQPYAAFLALIEKVNAPIMPKHIYEGTDPMTIPANQKPVGTGAFRFEEGVTGDHYTMVRNDSYFKKAQPYLDKIVVRIMPDEASASAAFERGEVDYMLFPPARDVARLAALPGVTRTDKGREAFASVTYFVFNLNRPALKDLRGPRGDRRRHRQAVHHRCRPERRGHRHHGTDLAGAEGLLQPERERRGPRRRAGQGARGRGQEAAPEAQLRARPVGGQPGDGAEGPVGPGRHRARALISLERNAWIDRIYKAKDFDLSYTNFENGPDPDIGVKRAFISSNIAQVPFSNAAGYNNPAVDKLLADAAISADAATRKQMYDEFQEIVSRDLPLHQTQSGVVFRSEFKGLHETSGRSTIYYEDTWSTKGTAKADAKP